MTAKLGHNSEREAYEQQSFLKSYGQIKELKSDIGGSMGEINGIYKTLKNLGFTKADVKWAMELEEKDAMQIMETMKRRLKIAKYFGHGVARQLSFLDKDRTPLKERARQEGYAAGSMRKEMSVNPHDLSTEAGQQWQKGFNEGHAFINAELASKFEDDDDEIIPGSADEHYEEAAE